MKKKIKTKAKLVEVCSNSPVEKNKPTMKLSDILKPLLFIFFSIVIEMVNFAFIHFKQTGNTGSVQLLPTYFVIDLAFILIVAGIMFICKRQVANIIMYFVLGFSILISCINATLYKVFGDIFSFDMMKLGKEAVAAFSLQFVELWSILANIGILALLITSQVLLDRKVKSEFEVKRSNKIAILISVFSIFWTFSVGGFFIQTANFKDTESSVAVAESDQYLWENMQFKLEAYKKFGTWGFYAKSIGNLIYKNDKPSQDLLTDIQKGLEEGQKETNTSATLYGDNLIMIMLESFEWYAMDPFNTPTLWKIRTQTGVSFENFYAKNKTNMSEDIGLMGNMSKDTLMSSLAKNGNLNTPWTLPNLFKQLGYTSNYFHGYRKTFYDRNVVNAGMGFENVYGVEDAKMENKSINFYDWNLDTDYIKSMVDKFIPDQEEPFFSFFTTVSTHGTYDTYNKRFEPFYQEYDSNLEEYKTWMEQETPYSFPDDEKMQALYRQYKCAAMDTDRMVSFILETLEEKGILENTTIVFYADHNGYYDGVCYDIKDTPKEEFYDTYINNIPAMILSSKIEHQVIETFCNTYDIYPTVCELFGLPYNTYMTQGFNIFSSDISKSIMVSYVSGMFKEDIYSLNIVDMYVTEKVTEQDMEFFKRDACRFYEKQHILELIYKYGLFKEDSDINGFLSEVGT